MRDSALLSPLFYLLSSPGGKAAVIRASRVMAVGVSPGRVRRRPSGQSWTRVRRPVGSVWAITVVGGDGEGEVNGGEGREGG